MELVGVLSSDKVTGHFLGREALVDELILVVDELGVGLEVVVFASQEFVHLSQPASILLLTIGHWTE